MKLWKRTVILMLVTLLCALIPVGALSIYVTGKRSLNNAAETYGRQLENGKTLLEQFWDNSKYVAASGSKYYAKNGAKCNGNETDSFLHFSLPPYRYVFLRFTVSAVQTPPLMNSSAIHSIRLLLSPVGGDFGSFAVTVSALAISLVPSLPL